MQKIKILMLSSMFPNLVHPVLGIFVSEFTTELQKYCDIRVISPVPWTPPVKSLPFLYQYNQIPFQKSIEGVTVYYPRMLAIPRQYFYFSAGIAYYLSIKALIAKIYQRWPFDLIHAHTLYPDGWAGAKLKKQYGKKMIVTIHGADVYHTIHKQPFCKTQITKAFLAADTVLCNSSKTAGKVNELIGNHKVKVSHMGINPIVVEQNQIAEELALVVKDKIVILTVGYLIERKGHAYMLHALSKLVNKFDNLVYLIVGSGPQEKSLKDLTEVLGLENHVHFMGLRPYEQVWQFLNLCDIFVLSSWNEAFGVAYIEAMSQGKPVIGCWGQGIEDIITDGQEGLLVAAKNVEDLVEKLEILISNADLRLRMGVAGKKRVKEKFTWGTIAQEVYQVYQEILQGSNGHLLKAKTS